MDWHLKKANKQLFLHFWGTLPNSFSISHCLTVRGIWRSCCWLNYRAGLPLSTHCLFHLSWHQHARPPGYAHLADGKAKRKSSPIFTVWRQKSPMVNPWQQAAWSPYCQFSWLCEFSRLPTRESQFSNLSHNVTGLYKVVAETGRYREPCPPLPFPSSALRLRFHVYDTPFPPALKEQALLPTFDLQLKRGGGVLSLLFPRAFSRGACRGRQMWRRGSGWENERGKK